MAELPNYWLARARVSRRRLIRTSVALGLSATTLAVFGCGGDESGESSSGLVTRPVDTTSKAAKGGVYPRAGSADVPSFDVYGGWTQAIHAYSRLLKFEAIKYPNPILASVVPDAAASWEISPDQLQMTLKLRSGMKFDSRSPTRGRVLTSEDVRYAWNRFEATAPSRSLLANSASKEAPILSVVSPDAQTVQLKLAFPYAPLTSMLAADRIFHLLPVEAENQFDIRQDMRGSGAWRLQEYIPSARVVYVRNPDWYDADKVNFDGITDFAIGEYSAGLSQFRNGTLWTYDVRPEDVLQTKRDLPQLLMQAQEAFPLSGHYMRFSYLPESPFRDARVRQAISMLTDRDLVIQAMRNTDQFSSAGLEVPTRWHTAVPAGEDGYWLDPKNLKEFGENAKYYQYDPTEAKKLLRAAGHTQPIQTKLTWGQTGDIQRHAEIMQDMWQAHGDFRVEARVLDYTSVIRPQYLGGFNRHEGIYSGTSATYPDVDGWLSIWYTSGQERTGHVDEAGRPDTNLDAMLAKQRVEFDLQKRIALVKDIQRYAASRMYLLHLAGDALGFDLAWPWLGNWGVFRSRSTSGWVQEGFIYQWYDESKRKQT